MNAVKMILSPSEKAYSKRKECFLSEQNPFQHGSGMQESKKEVTKLSPCGKLIQNIASHWSPLSLYFTAMTKLVFA